MYMYIYMTLAPSVAAIKPLSMAVINILFAGIPCCCRYIFFIHALGTATSSVCWCPSYCTSATKAAEPSRTVITTTARRAATPMPIAALPTTTGATTSAMCCSVLQGMMFFGLPSTDTTCVAACCDVLQCVAMSNTLQCDGQYVQV